MRVNSNEANINFTFLEIIISASRGEGAMPVLNYAIIITRPWVGVIPTLDMRMAWRNFAQSVPSTEIQ